MSEVFEILELSLSLSVELYRAPVFYPFGVILSSLSSLSSLAPARRALCPNVPNVHPNMPECVSRARQNPYPNPCVDLAPENGPCFRRGSWVTESSHWIKHINGTCFAYIALHNVLEACVGVQPPPSIISQSPAPRVGTEQSHRAAARESQLNVTHSLGAEFAARRTCAVGLRVGV